MTSINDLPTEILLQIIEETLLEIKYLPQIGENASWRPPRKFLAHQPTLPNPDYEKEFPSLEGVKKVVVDEYKSPVKVLRLTNRSLNRICSRYLFRDLNLFYNWSQVSIDTIHKYRMMRHWEYIQVLRINLDEGKSRVIYGKLHVEGAAAIILTCKNLQSLGLYFNDWYTNFNSVNAAVMNLIENQKLDSIGIYSTQVMNDDWHLTIPAATGIFGPTEILHLIAASDKASRLLKKLDITTQWMAKETYALLQSSPFPNLESLTVRYSFRREELWNPDPTQRTPRFPGTSLVRLQLINCQTVNAEEIPLMVQDSENLEELMISACGQGTGIIPPPRLRGWSHQSDALCLNRKPLRLFSLEHMIKWEILAMGTIPTTTLVSANVHRSDLIGALQDDPELFPGMRILRVLPDRGFTGGEDEPDPEDSGHSDRLPWMAVYIAERKATLEDLCVKRRVELRRDAARMRVCYCCAGY